MTSILKKSLILESRQSDPLFRYKQQEIQIKQKDILIKNICFSIDPVMMVWLSGAKTNFRQTKIGEVFNCFAVGVIVQGNKKLGLPKGTYLFGNLGTSNYALFDKKRMTQCMMIPPYFIKKYGPKKFLYLINNGLAAFAGYQVLNPKENQTVVVSTASGATGLILCELLKKKKIKCIGLTSKEKVQYLKNRVDIAVDYKDKQQLVKVLKQNQYSYYFDNVGEQILDLILSTIKNQGRIALCGAISSYSNYTDRGIKNIGLLISKRLYIQGVNFYSLMPRAVQIFKNFQGFDLALKQIRIEKFQEYFSQITKSGNKIIGKVIVDLQ